MCNPGPVSLGLVVAWLLCVEARAQLCQGSTGSTPDDDGCLTAVIVMKILIPTVVIAWDSDSRFRV